MAFKHRDTVVDGMCSLEDSVSYTHFWSFRTFKSSSDILSFVISQNLIQLFVILGDMLSF